MSNNFNYPLHSTPPRTDPIPPPRTDPIPPPRTEPSPPPHRYPSPPYRRYPSPPPYRRYPSPPHYRRYPSPPRFPPRFPPPIIYPPYRYPPYRYPPFYNNLYPPYPPLYNPYIPPVSVIPRPIIQPAPIYTVNLRVSNIDPYYASDIMNMLKDIIVNTNPGVNVVYRGGDILTVTYPPGVDIIDIISNIDDFNLRNGSVFRPNISVMYA